MQSPSNFVVPQLLPTCLQSAAKQQPVKQLVNQTVNQPLAVGQLEPQLFPEFATSSTSIPGRVATTTGSVAEVEVKPVEAALPVVIDDLGHNVSTGVLSLPPKKK